MGRFIQAEFPTQHAGLNRMTRGATALRQSVRNFDGARGTASLLLAALVSALVVVANELVTTWTEGHLLAAWIVTWLVAFAALGIFATPMLRAATGLRAGLASWVAARRQAAEDDKLWALAMTDARLMADLSRAMSADALTEVRRYY